MQPMHVRKILLEAFGVGRNVLTSSDGVEVRMSRGGEDLKIGVNGFETGDKSANSLVQWDIGCLSELEFDVAYERPAQNSYFRFGGLVRGINIFDRGWCNLTFAWHRNETVVKTEFHGQKGEVDTKGAT
jgi:hypothetical protein